MAYSTGDLILDNEYNIFATGNAAGSGDNSVANTNTLWGTGTGDYGYGESSTISAVAAAGVISATHWETLVGRMETIAAHQGSSVTAVSTISAGDQIAALANFQTDINTIFANRLNAAASGTPITSGGASARTATWAGQTGTQTITTTQRVAFASAAAARYWFNAGGLITITMSRSGGTTSDKNTEWANLTGDMGTVTLSGSDSHTVNGVAYTGTTQTGGAAGGSGSAKGTLDYHALTTSNQQLIKKYSDGSPYTANYIKVSALANGANLDITTEMVDDAADTANAAFPTTGNQQALDQVDGTITVTITAVPPSSTQLTSASWGTPALSTTEAL